MLCVRARSSRRHSVSRKEKGAVRKSSVGKSLPAALLYAGSIGNSTEMVVSSILSQSTAS